MNAMLNDSDTRMLGEKELRKKAAKRSWLCPGAGFAIAGRQAWAIATFVASLCMAPALAGIAFRPTAVSLGIAVSLLVVATMLSIAEQIAIRRGRLLAPGPSFLDHGIVPATCVMWLAVIVAMGLMATSFGKLRMAGSGMEPTLVDGELLIYHKRIDPQSVLPGALVVYNNADASGWGQAGWIVIARILAGPGDKIAIQDGNYVVNGAAGPPVAATGGYDAVLQIPRSPRSLTVPHHRYFIIQDSPSGGFDSRVLSWATADNIIATRLWRLGGGKILQTID